MAAEEEVDKEGSSSGAADTDSSMVAMLRVKDCRMREGVNEARN